jgi:hypothetical protein
MGSFARPTDVELRSKVVRNTVLFGLDASFDPGEATAFHHADPQMRRMLSPNDSPYD